MPYITKDRRKALHEGDRPQTRGDITYCLFYMCRRIIERRGNKYEIHSGILDNLEEIQRLNGLNGQLWLLADELGWSHIEEYPALCSAARDCALEWYRRCIAPYEDTKKHLNGDVF